MNNSEIPCQLIIVFKIHQVGTVLWLSLKYLTPEKGFFSHPQWSKRRSREGDIVVQYKSLGHVRLALFEISVVRYQLSQKWFFGYFKEKASDCLYNHCNSFHTGEEIQFHYQQYKHKTMNEFIYLKMKGKTQKKKKTLPTSQTRSSENTQ